MAMAPEHIAEREFLLVIRGYEKGEVREFLARVAAAYRTALASSGTGPSDAATTEGPPSDPGNETAAESDARATAAATIPGAGTGTTSPEDWVRMGEEVVAVLRTAHEQVAALKTKAEKEAAEQKRSLEAQADLIKVEAEKFAAEVRLNAQGWAEARQREADADREVAKRALANAQDEARSLVADTETRANRMLDATERQAEGRAEQVLEAARAQLHDLTQRQAETHQRLEGTRIYLARALDSFQSTSTLDLSKPAEAVDLTGEDDGVENAANKTRTP